MIRRLPGDKSIRLNKRSHFEAFGKQQEPLEKKKTTILIPRITIPPGGEGRKHDQVNLNTMPQLQPHRRLRKASHSRAFEPPPDYNPRVLQILGRLWTQKTWTRKRSVWKQYAAFHRKKHGLFPDRVHESSAMEFVARTEERLGAVSAKEYGKDLQAMKEKLRKDLPSLIRALSAADSHSESQAPTMLPASFREALKRLPPPEKRTAYLQWMTASRWADVANPDSPPEVVPIDTKECGVLFGKTKSTGQYPYREDLQVILRSEPRIPSFFIPPPAAPLSTWTTSRMDEWMKQLPPPSAEEKEGSGRATFTTHSIKRGALRQLTMEAAKKDDFPPHLIGLLAKHKGAVPAIAPVTMRYLKGQAARLAMARILKTQDATVLMNPF